MLKMKKTFSIENVFFIFNKNNLIVKFSIILTFNNKGNIISRKGDMAE